MPLADGEGITTEELQLAARNHGMPLEALRHDVTPVGLHYLLIHYDIPYVDPATYRLTIGDRELSLDEIRALPSVTRPVTMECAGNGRAALAPRPISQPWLLEAVGNAEWTGTPLKPLLEDAAGRRGPLHRPGPRRRERDPAGLRAVAAVRGRDGGRRPARLRAQRRPAAAAARLPAPAPRPRLVRHDEREVADADHRPQRALRRLPERDRLPRPSARGRARHARRPDRAARAVRPARRPRLHDPPPLPRGGPDDADGPRVVGPRRDRRRSRSTPARAGARPSSGRSTAGARSASTGTRRRASTSCAAARPTRPAAGSLTSRHGTSAATPTTRSTASR